MTTKKIQIKNNKRNFKKTNSIQFKNKIAKFGCGSAPGNLINLGFKYKLLQRKLLFPGG